MSIFAMKLVTTPLLIGVATVAARRWGQSVGGWFAGLPLTSGPISVFLAIEQGPTFARGAAEATLLGLVGVAAFCCVYHRAMALVSPCGAALLSVAAHMLATLVVSFFPSGLAFAVPLLVAVLSLALLAIGAPGPQSSYANVARWDLPLRMLFATVMVLAITGAAALLGPRWSGLLSPFPVFACVMAVFAHHGSGPAAAQRLLRGIVVGSFAFAAFFVIVALTLERASIVPSYALAVVAALGVNGLSLFALLREARAG
jgi:hypothetical protein